MNYVPPQPVKDPPNLIRSAASHEWFTAAMAGVLLLFGTTHLSPLDWIAGAVLGFAAFVAVLLLTREVTVAELAALPRWVRARMSR